MYPQDTKKDIHNSINRWINLKENIVKVASAKDMHNFIKRYRGFH